MTQKKYISFSRLQDFLNNLRNLFATKTELENEVETINTELEKKSELTLGTTSTTAYRGDRGNTAYTHASAKGSAFSSGLYKVTTNAHGHVTAATPVEKSDITALGIPEQDTVYGAITNAEIDEVCGTAISSEDEVLS